MQPVHVGICHHLASIRLKLMFSQNRGHQLHKIWETRSCPFYIFDEPIYFASLYIIMVYLFHPAVVLEMNSSLQAEIGNRWGRDMRWTCRISPYCWVISKGFRNARTQADRLTHLSTEDGRFPQICALKALRRDLEQWAVENALNYFYTHTFTSALIWEPRHISWTQYFCNQEEEISFSISSLLLLSFNQFQWEGSASHGHARGFLVGYCQWWSPRINFLCSHKSSAALEINLAQRSLHGCGLILGESP